VSVSGVSSGDSFQTSVAQGAQNTFQQIQSQFQKVGQDLQSGNLTQAQSDFATLTKDLPSNLQSTAATATTAAGGTTPTNTLAKSFQTLGQDLQAGNLSAAQSDFATIQQDVQQGSGQAGGHHHHHHGGGGGASTQQPTNTLQQDFGALGQALQSGSLTSAQQAYSTFQADLQQQFPNFSAATGSSTGDASSTSCASGGTVNVTA
jgi:hypothetical protein